MCSNLCSVCKRAAYVRKHGPEKPFPGRDLTPDQLRKILNYFTKVYFCGQVSDPIFNKHFIELLEICYQRNVMCHVYTAASARPESWYRQAFAANPDAKWVFGIDGPPEVSHLYRVNQKGEFLFKMMVMAREMGLDVEWQVIVFSFNEDRLEECYELAKKHDLNINIVISSRGLDPSLLPRNPKYNVVRG